MRNKFLLFAVLSYCALNANNLSIVKTYDCVELANEAENEAGDAGDYEVWSDAFEHCANEQGIKTVVIKG